jgi:hypothetical protein
MLIAREGFQADQHDRGRIAVSSSAHLEAARRHWPGPAIRYVMLPPAQIAPNLRAGLIDLAVLSETAARPILEAGIARIVKRLSEPNLDAALLLRKHWATAHRPAALALRDALAVTRLAG